MFLQPSDIALELSNQWKKNNPNFIARPNHVCNCQECSIVNVIGWVSQDLNTAKKIKISLEKPNVKKRKKITQLYICKETGQYHWCHAQCNARRAQSSDQGCVCTISGIRYESERADSWIPQYRITATAQEHRDPHAIRMGNTGYTSHSTSYRTQQHIEFAKKSIQLLIFSRRRLFAEQRKYFEQKQAAEKLLSKYYKSCERQKQPVIFTDMVTLYINQIQRRRVFHGLLPQQKEKIQTVVDAYAKRVCVLWNIIIQKTPMGKSSGSLFSFKSFVAAALYIMKRGMFCSGIEIIPKDYYLESVLPEANTLDHYSVNKPTFTQAKNNMMRAIREAMELYQVNPKVLVMPPFESPFK